MATPTIALATPSAPPEQRAESSSFLRNLTLALTAAVAMAAASLPAQEVHNTTGLRRAGPIDPVTHFPRWYEDTTGLRLKQCTDPGLCFFFPPNPAEPASYPTNWPDEMFYWAADANAAGPLAQRLLYVAALEMAYSGGSIVAGDEVVFARVRVRITGLVPGATYKITHPYGVEMQDADLVGVVNMTRDVGIGSPGDFQGALHGDVGPFLVPVEMPTPPAPGSFISDGATDFTVTGSPFNTNYIRVEGPNVGDAFPDFMNPDAALGPDPLAINDVIDVQQFSLQGQVADVMDVDLLSQQVVKNAHRTAVDVWANSASGQSLQAAVDNGLWVNMAEKGTTGAYYCRIELGAVAPRPAQLMLRNLTDTPATVKTYSSLPDGVHVRSAVFTIGGDLVVTAVSTDPADNPVLTPFVDGVAMAPLQTTGTPGLFSSGCGLAVGTPPPNFVTVRSSLGGTVTVPVEIEGSGFVGVPVTPIVANAGPDITVSPGQRFSLSGAASTGPVVGWQWTHNALPALGFVLENPATPTPVFTVPNIVGNNVDVLVTLRVTDEFGTPATDTMVIHIVNPVALDRIAITDARYVSTKQSWRVAGSATQRQSQTVSIWLGPVGNNTRRIGTAIVDGAGSWSFTGANGSAGTNGTVPIAGDSTVWAASALGGDPAFSNFRRQ